MSLVTRCPACATTFKVVRDQLRISDGWVRCGRCSQVFDANLDLQETPEAASAPNSDAGVKDEPPPEEPRVGPSDDKVRLPASLPGTPDEVAPSTGAGTGVAPKADLEERWSDAGADPVDDDPDFMDDEAEAGIPTEEPARPEEIRPASSPNAPATYTGFVADEPWSEDLMRVTVEAPVVPRYPSFPPFPRIDLNLPSALSPPPSPLAAQVLPSRDIDRTAEDTGGAQLQKALRRARAKSAKIEKAKRGRELKAAAAAREPTPVVVSASEPDTGFGVERRSPRAPAAATALAIWRRVSQRRWLLGAAVAGGVVLIGQIVHQERDLIAARQPALRPALAALCGLTGCELSALRQIGSISIDGASFAREKSGDGYRLSFTLRNGAAIPLAMPSIELSLLDTQERAVIRRVLMPVEFGAPSTLAARGERAASLSLALSQQGLDAAALPSVAGFRIEALYP